MSDQIALRLAALEERCRRVAETMHGFDSEVATVLARITERLDALEQRCQMIELRLRGIENKVAVIPVAEYLPRG